jgi:hypothetical protein
MVKRACNANDTDACIFTGSGATAAIQKLISSKSAFEAVPFSSNTDKPTGYIVVVIRRYALHPDRIIRLGGTRFPMTPDLLS